MLPPAAAEIIFAGQIGQLMSDMRSPDGPHPAGWFRCEDAGRFPNLDVFDAYRCVLLDTYEQMETRGDPPTWTGTAPPRWATDAPRR